jgi:hypothetical protein
VPPSRRAAPRRTIAISSIAIATALLLGGCGSDGGDAGRTPVEAGIDVVVPGNFPNTGSTDAGSIMFEVIPHWPVGDESAHNLLSIMQPTQWENRLHVTKYGHHLGCIIASDTGQEAAAYVSLDSWRPDEPHVVAVSWSGGCANVYVDGALVTRLTYSGVLQLAAGTPMRVGGEATGNAAAASIERLTVYGRPVAEDEVVAHFTAHADAVVLRAASVAVAEPTGATEVCVELWSDGHEVVGVQNDLLWDTDCAQLVEPCRATAGTGHTLFTSESDFSLRAVLLNPTALAPIADGPLYCCRFAPTDSDAGSCCHVQIANAATSDADGALLPTRAIDGPICVPASAAPACGA